MRTIFVAHAAADAAFAWEIGAFLEAGCDVSVFEHDGEIGAGEDLIRTAESGLAADVLLLLLSKASNPERWVRERWEPVLFEGAVQTGTRVGVVLLEECKFPALLRRGAGFSDATTDRTAALRRLKRWIWGIHLGTEPAMTFSPDLDEVYRDVADRVGVASVAGKTAQRFAQEACRDFEAVIWVPAHGRTLAQVSGEAGAQLGLRLPGPVEADCAAVRRMLSDRRCLLVLDAPTVDVTPLLPEGRSSVLFTREPVGTPVEAANIGGARRLVATGRVSEAYEAFNELLSAGTETEACARELIWINEQWDRMEEANRLRYLVNPGVGEQLGLLF